MSSRLHFFPSLNSTSCSSASFLDYKWQLTAALVSSPPRLQTRMERQESFPEVLFHSDWTDLDPILFLNQSPQYLDQPYLDGASFRPHKREKGRCPDRSGGCCQEKRGFLLGVSMPLTNCVTLGG